MTRAQIDLLVEMVSDAVILKLKGFLTEEKLSFATFKELDKKSTKDFIEKNVDIFGNLKPQPTQKEILEHELHKLEEKWHELLKDEKYELLNELKEIYEKIKKDYDKLK
tara:strand:+ start:482 stop:808 length:327 start_codon:yes stop_codon:yes gene_type:complete